ncbi:hypothetical protein C1X61_21015 [Pseudomonas sp. FW215-T2]|nr:hypothetical protein C1X61_21015 [Pseudomonas sp. FW215-T2]PNA11279.1 hypothetical protein C1X62_15975 [Pseudomonas sp. FW215-R3]PNB37108.1 hypothetical protein C1X63_14620 [Pseudomonas sp. FW305-131]
MVVNDNACFLVKRGESESIASKLAPTELPPRWSELPRHWSPGLPEYWLFDCPSRRTRLVPDHLSNAGNDP